VTFKAFAQCQIEQAKAKKIPTSAVACAWTAAKVLSIEDTAKRYGVRCDGSVSCEGKSDGFYCAAAVGAGKAISYKCGGAKVASQQTCGACVEYHADRSKANCTQ
jgi:hypothetical protein